MVPNIAPKPGQPVAGAAPKRSRKRELSKVDPRTVAGRRIVELKRLFASELASAGLEITPMRQLKIDAAAQATALAEKARSRFLREGTGDVADLVAVQRNADAAVRRIGLPVDRPPAPAAGVSAPSMPASVRAPTISEVAAEQVRRAQKRSPEAVASTLGPGADLSGLSNDELDRLRTFLGGEAGAP